MPDISSLPTEQLQAMLAKQTTSNVPVSSAGAPEISTRPNISSISTVDLQKMADQHAATNLPSKALAGASSAASGMIEGAAKVAQGLPNIGANIVEKGLDYLNKAGIVPDSVAKGFAKGRSEYNKAYSDVINKVTGFQQSVAAPSIAANPTVSKVGSMLGNVLGGTLASGGLASATGGLSAVNAGILQQGVSGALIGAGENVEHPLEGAIKGAVVGGVAGGIGGRLIRKSAIINDKIEEAAKAGYGPFSQQAQASIKKALENGGEDLSKEELEQSVRSEITKKLESVAPKVDLNKAPATQIADLAKANFTSVKATKNALYEPLNKSTDAAATPLLSDAISSVKSKATQSLLPDALPANPTISDLMSYRRQTAAALDQATAAVKNGTGDFRAIEELDKVKTAVTQDLNDAAAKSGLGDQLAKADTFHKNNYLPFQVYNRAGQLVSERDATKAWTVINKALMTPRPNLDKITEISKTLGPQGKEIVGHAYLQQAVKNSVELDGKVNIATLKSKFNKLENSGLADQILTPELREAFDGMKQVVDGANKIMKGSDKAAKGVIMSTIDSLTHNAGGIMILRSLGSKTAPAAKVKNFIAKMLTNGASYL